MYLMLSIVVLSIGFWHELCTVCSYSHVICMHVLALSLLNPNRFLLYTLPSPPYSHLHQQAFYWLNQPRVQFETWLELPHQQQQITGVETLLQGVLPRSWYLCEAKRRVLISWINLSLACTSEYDHCSLSFYSFWNHFVCALSVSVSSIGEVPEWLCHC